MLDIFNEEYFICMPTRKVGGGMGDPFISWDNLSVKSAPFYPSIKYMNLVKVKHSAVLGLLCHFCVLF